MPFWPDHWNDAFESRKWSLFLPQTPKELEEPDHNPNEDPLLKTTKGLNYQQERHQNNGTPIQLMDGRIHDADMRTSIFEKTMPYKEGWQPAKPHVPLSYDDRFAAMMGGHFPRARNAEEASIAMDHYMRFVLDTQCAHMTQQWQYCMHHAKPVHSIVTLPKRARAHACDQKLIDARICVLGSRKWIEQACAFPLMLLRYSMLEDDNHKHAFKQLLRCAKTDLVRKHVRGDVRLEHLDRKLAAEKRLESGEEVTIEDVTGENFEQERADDLIVAKAFEMMGPRTKAVYSGEDRYGMKRRVMLRKMAYYAKDQEWEAEQAKLNKA